MHDNGIGMHSTHNKIKSVVAERFIRTLTNTIYKHITAVTENDYYKIQQYLNA